MIITRCYRVVTSSESLCLQCVHFHRVQRESRCLWHVSLHLGFDDSQSRPLENAFVLTILSFVLSALTDLMQGRGGGKHRMQPPVDGSTQATAEREQLTG